MPTFRPYEPQQQLLLPPSLHEWLPPDHLVWFISETVDQLDLSEILEGYRDGGQGNLPYHPAMMLKILIYAHATGVFSSRRIARQIEENIAFRVLAAGHMPDHRTVCHKQRKHLAEPPFGWMKRVLGFRQFGLRSLSKVTAEFNLVCLALNLRRMATMIRC